MPVSRLLYCLGWGILDTEGCNTTDLFVDKYSLIVFSTTLLANPNRHNLVVHIDGCRAALFASSKQSSGLYHTSCLQLGHSFLLRTTAGWRLSAPCKSY